MENVFQIKSKRPRSDVVAHFEKQLARAKAGEITGGIEVVSIHGSDDQGGIFGSFADDPAYAQRAAQATFECLGLHVMAMPSMRALPLRLQQSYPKAGATRRRHF